VPTMRAVVQTGLGGVDMLQLQELAVPDQPAGDQVLLRVEACGVCYHDVLVRTGTFRQYVELPLIPGHELAGVVEAVGPDVLEIRPGDRVASTNRETCGHCRWCRSGHEPQCRHQRFFGHNIAGGYAELTLARENSLVVVPPSIAPETAAILSCAVGTEMHALKTIGRIQAGDVVAITGAGGGLGIHGVQLARLAGATVIAITTSPAKVDVLGEQGADEVLVVEKGERFDKRLRAIAPRGIDIICDNVGEPVFASCFPSLAVEGRYVFVGQLNDREISLNPAWLLLHETRLVGSRSSTRAELADLVQLVADGRLSPVVEQVLPLSEAANAHELVERSAMTGRLVLTP
jgi:acryloyl-coenzyme A reductase